MTSILSSEFGLHNSHFKGRVLILTRPQNSWIKIEVVMNAKARVITCIQNGHTDISTKPAVSIM